MLRKHLHALFVHFLYYSSPPVLETTQLSKSRVFQIQNLGKQAFQTRVSGRLRILPSPWSTRMSVNSSDVTHHASSSSSHVPKAQTAQEVPRRTAMTSRSRTPEWRTTVGFVDATKYIRMDAEDDWNAHERSFRFGQSRRLVSLFSVFVSSFIQRTCPHTKTSRSRPRSQQSKINKDRRGRNIRHLSR